MTTTNDSSAEPVPVPGLMVSAAATEEGVEVTLTDLDSGARATAWIPGAAQIQTAAELCMALPEQIGPALMRLLQEVADQKDEL